MGTDSEDDDDQIGMQGKRNKLSGRRNKAGNDRMGGDYDEEDDFDHDGFMEQMLADMHSAQEEEVIKQGLMKKKQAEEDERQEKEKNLKEAEYNDNQYWKTNESYDIDDLLDEYDN